jgi:hypothetical protein
LLSLATARLLVRTVGEQEQDIMMFNSSSGEGRKKRKRERALAKAEGYGAKQCTVSSLRYLESSLGKIRSILVASLQREYSVW